MTTPVTLNAIATDVVGHYGNAAKSLVAAYRTSSARALAAGGNRYAKLVERIPCRFSATKARLASSPPSGASRVWSAKAWSAPPRATTVPSSWSPARR